MNGHASAALASASSAASFARRISPLLTIAALLAAARLVVVLWPASRWWSKALLALLLVPTAAGVWLEWQNHFGVDVPPAGAAFARADAATFVDRQGPYAAALPMLALIADRQRALLAHGFRAMPDQMLATGAGMM